MYSLITLLDQLIPLNRELLKGDSRGLLKLRTDKVLVEDPEFRKYVILYAQVTPISLLFYMSLKWLESLTIHIIFV